MNIFVTGGTGFIGKQVVNILSTQDHSLILLSRTAKNKSSSKIRLINGDLRGIEKWQNKLKRLKPDVVIHLAWEGLPNHQADISKKNLEYGLNLIELSANIGCKKFITTGSGWEYGTQTGKMSENTSPIPFDAFTAAKHALHWLGQEIAKEKNMIFIWTRPFFVYGPSQHPKSLIPYLIKCFNTGKIPEIRNPNAQNDFIYVKDVADAICKLLTKCRRDETYNIGSGKLTKVSDITNYLSKKYDRSNYKKAKKESRDKIGSAYADISKIKKDIGWSPSTSIKEGIDKTVQFYQINK